MAPAQHTVILGAGAAGLAAAHELTRHGRAVTVLEARPGVGGLCRTVEHRGYRFDLGGHRWFTQNADLDAWFHRVMAGELVPVDRISRIHFQGRYYLYPIDLPDLVRQRGVAFLARAGFSFLRAALAQRLRAAAPRDMRQAYIAQFGRVLFEMFFRHYTEKVWGRACEDLSADWVAQRSRGLSIWPLLKQALGRGGSGMASLVDRFHYPATGYGRLPERLAEDVQQQGGELALGARVTEVRCHAPEDFEVVYEQQGQRHGLRAACVLSTVPLGLLVKMLQPARGEAVRAAAQALAFRDLITVNLMIRRERVSADTWVYVQDAEVLFGRLHEPKNWSAAMVPDASRTSLVLECFCSRGDAIWAMDDEAIARRCIDDLSRRLGLLQPDEVEDWLVVRTVNAYPVYDLGYAARLELIRQDLGQLPGLHTLGRSGTFRYNNADHSVEMGLLLARQLLGHDVDPLAVNTEASYQETVLPGARPRPGRFVLAPVQEAGDATP